MGKRFGIAIGIVVVTAAGFTAGAAFRPIRLPPRVESAALPTRYDSVAMADAAHARCGIARAGTRRSRATRARCSPS